MSQQSDSGRFVALLLLFFLLFVMGVIGRTAWTSGIERERLRWQKECVTRGVAEYDRTTSEWKWTVEPKVSP